MSTNERFSSETFRTHAIKLMEIGTKRELPSLPFEIGKAAAFLENAADYIDTANALLAEAMQCIDDDAVTKKIEALLK